MRNGCNISTSLFHTKRSTTLLLFLDLIKKILPSVNGSILNKDPTNAVRHNYRKSESNFLIPSNLLGQRIALLPQMLMPLLPTPILPTQRLQKKSNQRHDHIIQNQEDQEDHTRRKERQQKQLNKQLEQQQYKHNK